MARLHSAPASSPLGERAVEALCGIASTPAGLARLLASRQAEGESGELALLRKRVCAGVQSQAGREVRVVAMHSLAAVFESPLLCGDAHRAALTELFDAVFGGAAGGGLPAVLQCRSDAVVALRAAFLHLFHALAALPCAAAAACRDQGAWEWLLDVDAEADKECKEWKYGATQRMVQHCVADLEALRGAQEVLELRTVARLGPFATAAVREAGVTMRID